MDSFTLFPNKATRTSGILSKQFRELGITTFIDACRFVHDLPYGYNSDRDDPMILFREKMGTCTTKHAVVAELAAELDLPVNKSIGIYAMTEDIVEGACALLTKYGLPFIPMVHCFLVCGDLRVDLTEGNNNGKRRAIEEFLYTRNVAPDISAKDEYMLYRKFVKDVILKRKEFDGIAIKIILLAREEAVALLKRKVKECPPA